MDSINAFKPCEIENKPYRMYYKDDWRCDCESHSKEDYIKILNNVFKSNDAEFNDWHNWKGEQDDYYAVTVIQNNGCSVFMDEIRNAEFHGLMLNTIFTGNKNTLRLHFKSTGWFA